MACEAAPRRNAEPCVAIVGTHFQLAETLSSPKALSIPRPRIMVGGVGERKTLRLVAQYADACNLPVAPSERLGVRQGPGAGEVATNAWLILVGEPEAFPGTESP